MGGMLSIALTVHSGSALTSCLVEDEKLIGGNLCDDSVKYIYAIIYINQEREIEMSKR